MLSLIWGMFEAFLTVLKKVLLLLECIWEPTSGKKEKSMLMHALYQTESPIKFDKTSIDQNTDSQAR